jgi:hypothetical protein
LLVTAALSGASAQNASPSVPPERTEVYRTTGSRIAIGRNIRIPPDEEVIDVVVAIGGSVRVDGRVRDGMVVIGGDVELGPQADVRGDVVLVGGQLVRQPGAQLRGSVSDVSFGDWGWSWGGISLPGIDLGGMGRWLTLLGAMFRIAMLALVMAFMLLVARAPVARIGRSAGAAPVRAFLLGIVAAVFFIPILVATSLGLVLTIVGIPLLVVVIPGALCLLFVALTLGFTAMACRIGEWVEDRLGWRAHSAVLATGVGLLIIAGPSMLSRILGLGPGPVGAVALGLLLAGMTFEFIVWTIGFGATLMTGFGRWSTAPPPVPPPAPAAAVVVA